MPGFQKPSCSYNIKPAVPDSRTDCESIHGDGMVLPVTDVLPWFNQFFPYIPSLHFRFLLRTLPYSAMTISNKLKSRQHFLSTREWQAPGNMVSQCIQQSLSFHQFPCLEIEGNGYHKHNNTQTATFQTDRILSLQEGCGPCHTPIFCSLRLA